MLGVVSDIRVLVEHVHSFSQNFPEKTMCDAFEFLFDMFWCTRSEAHAAKVREEEQCSRDITAEFESITFDIVEYDEDAVPDFDPNDYDGLSYDNFPADCEMEVQWSSTGTNERSVTHSVSDIERDERSTIETFFDGCASIFESQQDFELPDAVKQCLPTPAKQQQLSGKNWFFGGCYPHFVLGASHQKS